MRYPPRACFSKGFLHWADECVPMGFFFYLLLFDALDYTRFSLLFSQLLLRSSLSRLGAVCFFEFGVPLVALYNSSPLIRYLQIARR